MEDRGIGCKNCLVNQGVVSFEECMGCNGNQNCNEDYFPSKPKEKQQEELKQQHFDRNIFNFILKGI